jgi:multiple sugar transport system permease protein
MPRQAHFDKALSRDVAGVRAVLFPALLLAPSTNLKADAEVFAMPPVWIPKTLMWGNFGGRRCDVPFGMYLMNTLVISVLSVIGAVASSSLVAYSLARLRWPVGTRCSWSSLRR